MSNIKFGTYSSYIQDNGFLAYEYNPFHNYRLSYNTDSKGLTKNQILYHNKIYDKIIRIINGESVEGIYISDQKKFIPLSDIKTEVQSYNDESKREAGTIQDLDTDKLNFSLNHPVDIEVQESYDGSVNLILNDGYNIPRLINSRFTPRSLSTYERVDRAGNNDTNLYDDSQFDLDTSLYKIWNKIPQINYKGLVYSGNLKVGNYVFYFKYADADGNETDFIGESGLVSVFIGNDSDPFSINGGYKNMNSNKGVQFQINNIDQAYDYLVVYYTRSYADLKQNRVTSAYKVHKKFTLHTNSTSITIFGTEDTTEVPLSDLNLQYFVANKANTQTQCSNRLFLGGVSKPNIDYKELTDLSLRILPKSQEFNKNDLIGNVSLKNFVDINGKYEYYNTKNIYNYVGYWPEEIYRFGVVYILSDNTRTSVFNVRGIDFNLSEDYTYLPLLDGENIRNYIVVDEETGLLSEGNQQCIENGKGVIRFKSHDQDKIIGIKFQIPNEVVKQLKELNIKGLFFVRQKRIPTILAQALLMPVDNNNRQESDNVDVIHGSYLPLLYYKNDNGEINYRIQSFVNYDKSSGYELKSTGSTVNIGNKVQVNKNNQLAAFCPEFEQNMPYYNQFFTGSKYYLKPVTSQESLEDLSDSRLCVYKETSIKDKGLYDVNIISVTEDVPTVAIQDKIFKLIAGEGEDVSRYAQAGVKEDNIFVRGIFGPYLGIKTKDQEHTQLFGTIANIYISNYSTSKMQNYFEQRYQDDSPYYSISNYFTLQDIERWNSEFKEVIDKENKKHSKIIYTKTFYKGDCYICPYTHRVNRNFNDPYSPNNDKLVKNSIDGNNYWGHENNSTPDWEKINRGDINAVKLGKWVTFRVRSTTNLCLRSVDESYVSEAALMGSPRSFYPYSQLLDLGENKIPESTVYNDGFRSTVSERWHEKLPDVPYYKNSFENRILYSEIAINDAFKNGYRVFYSTSFQDYKKEYGKIIKLEEISGNVLCVFEKAVGLIPVNERTVAGNGDGGEVFINSNNVLPQTPRIVSDMYGSQWKESIIKTPYYIYGVDTRAKKIWRTNGQSFDIISDLKVNKFLVDNITLKERELDTIIGVRNVKTHYNANKSDVMFTFYDNKEGFEEHAWNLCYNEITQNFVTFYSWIPSYSANIQNQFWSFDRETSKAIAKLGTSMQYSTNSDGIILNSVVIDDSFFNKGIKIEGIINRIIPSKNYKCEYSLVENMYSKYFEIEEENGDWFLKPSDKLNDSDKLTKFNYERILFETIPGHLIHENINLKHPVVYLNIQVKILEETTPDNWRDFIDDNTGKISLSSYQSTIALTSKNILNNPKLSLKDDDIPSLCTDFWIHGKAGLIDIKEQIKPTYWYGKQHPFEFEFVVNSDPQTQKIFNNLRIISNKAEPESFHFEIVGEGYEFVSDKLNMYYRQEATKELLQNIGYNILYNKDYIYSTPNFNVNEDYMDNVYSKEFHSGRLSKSTIFPTYYFRNDTFNELYDIYTKMNWEERNNNILGSYDISGSEIVRNEDLDEYRILTHVQNLPINKFGRRKGNSFYKEDEWRIQIPPIYFKQSNESAWNLPPMDLNVIRNTDIDVNTNSSITINDIPKQYKGNSESLNYNWFTNSENWVQKQTRLRDKYIKIRIRYSGKDLAVIHSLTTLFEYSYA